MGQRSQIYIRYPAGEKKGLIARYFSWNYGERMVSRASGIIKMAKRQSSFDDEGIKKLILVCDVNFDMRDISLSSDIIEEVAVFCEGVSNELFAQDNNDGQLLVDIRNGVVKYAFIPYYDNPAFLDGEGYLAYDLGMDWREKLDPEVLAYTEKNLAFIAESAVLMSEDEVREFLSYDYSHLFEEVLK